MDKVDVLLPRFTMTRGIDVRSELKSLGVNTLFDGFADLSGMDGSTRLYVDSVIHQAFVEVNEQGTEAAAVTVAVAKSKGMTSSFVADHPFIFLIRDNATGSILFLGRVVDPTKS
jgi:serpin B